MQHRHLHLAKLLNDLLVLIVLGSSSCIVSANDKTPMTAVEQGKRIYREGLFISGKPLEAKTEGNMDVSGEYLACISCHRRSGLGSYEGKVQIPPIAGRILLAGQLTANSPQSAQSTKGYTEASLRETIRSGITPDGRTLHPLMPCYKYQDQDSDALIAYLKTLSAHDSPGADAQNMHFATAVSEKARRNRSKLLDFDVVKKVF